MKADPHWVLALAFYHATLGDDTLLRRIVAEICEFRDHGADI